MIVKVSIAPKLLKNIDFGAIFYFVLLYLQKC